MEFIINLLNDHPEIVVPFFLNSVMTVAKKAIGKEKMRELGLRRWMVPCTMVLGMLIVYLPFSAENFFFQGVPKGALWLYGACMGFISNGLYAFHKQTLKGQ